MLLAVEHKFAFEYDGYISESFLELRVQPKITPQQHVLSFRLAVGPPTRVFRYLDWNDNLTHHFTITKFHDRIAVTAQSIIETRPPIPSLTALDQPVAPSQLPYPLLDFLECGGPVRLTPALRAAHRAMAPAGAASVAEHVQTLSAAMAARFGYKKDVTTYDSSTEEFLRIGAGVCQDFTHLMLGLLRLSGIPCRYVSGYLHVDRKTREVAQSHAWVEVYAPSVGWVPFDPTHNRTIDERYVVVGHGRHYDDVPPNKGIYRGSARELLRAEVHTQPTTAKAVPRLINDDVTPIDLQVFAVSPQRRPDAVMSASADEQSQQQQQQ